MHLVHSSYSPFITFYCVLLMYFTLIDLAFMTTITILLHERMVYYQSYLLARLQRTPL